MRVERQVRTVDGQIVFHQQPEQFVSFARPWMRRRPEQSVMHDEQIRFGGDGEFDRGKAGVHGGGDFGDRSPAIHLQSVGRAVVITDGFRAEQLVAMFNNGGE